MLTEPQITDVWEGWLASEIRADYFAELVTRYQGRQSLLSWLTLLLSSGAFASALRDWQPEHFNLPAAFALLAAGISGYSLIISNQKRAFECSNLHSRWTRLAQEYKTLWSNLYSEDAAEKLARLDEKSNEISVSGNTLPNDERLMLKWENYVLQQHHCQPVSA